MATVLKRRRAYNSPTRWSGRDEERLLTLLKKGECSVPEICRKFPRRTKPSVRSKIRKLRIKHDLFGRGYREDKDGLLKKVASSARPRTVFDAYAGSGRQSFLWAGHADTVYAAERNTDKQAQFVSRAKKSGYKKSVSDKPGWLLFCLGKRSVYFWKGDAVKAAMSLGAASCKVDLLDLDTCGTTLPTLPMFLTALHPRHLVITYGEFHSFRFGREDVLRRVLCHRDINSSRLPQGIDGLKNALHKATLVYALRAHNDIERTFWLKQKKAKGYDEWLGGKSKGILRRYYTVAKPPAAADCLNALAG